MATRGNLSINSENMFPIIKKWLYSDHDIFYREVISNACDAITKVKKMDVMGDYQLPNGFKGRVDIILNDKDKAIKICDNGIGMTEDEVTEYINQVAFSGATDFLEKYKDKANDDQIIGHFGLGFYSTFMVSDSVEIDTLSYKEGAKAVHWVCDGSSEFEMSDGSRDTVGTTITLHLSDDCLEFCNEYKAREVIQKYCSFMPTEIYLSRENETDTQTIKESEKLEDDVVIEEIVPEKKDSAEGTEEKKEEEKQLKIRRRPELMNDPNPLWTKTPSSCEKDEYLEFYRKVFLDYKEPLFWIHLNMDYPFNLKGILYFPKINIEYESIEGVIKLYNNQVFIADNIKEVIPEFLMLLKGVIDCPDLPLNVSRSALQNDGFVTKISDYITKKVAEKLSGMCKTDKETYEKYWEDISPFVKYGYLRNQKFAEKINDFILFKDINDKYLTLPECLDVKPTEEAEVTDAETGEKVEAEVVDETPKDGENTDEKKEEKPEHTIYYVTDEKQQGQYINMFKSAGMTAVILRHNIDTPFMQQLEMKNEGVKFKRIDSDVTDTMKSEETEDETKSFKEKAESIQKVLREALKKEKLEVSVQKLKDATIASMMTLSEESRRMQDMMKMYSMNGLGGMDDFADDGQTLILNANHPLVKKVMDTPEDEQSKLISEQLYDLAMLANKQLSPAEMTAFITRSNEIMMQVAGLK